MSYLAFEVLGAKPEGCRALPTLSLRLAITESTEAKIHAIALRCQVQIRMHAI